MDGRALFSKTDKGHQEIANRTFGVSASLRQILIMIDGSVEVEQFLHKYARLPKIEERLEELESGGFIVRLGAEESPPVSTTNANSPVVAIKAVQNATGVRTQMIASAEELLGPEGARAIVKLHEAHDTRDGLEAATKSAYKIIKLTISESKAEEFKSTCSEMIAKLPA